MLRALMVTAFIIPAAVSTMASSADTVETSYNLPSYEAYSDQHIAKLELCESADIPVFFHEGYIEMHSADYLDQAVNAAKNCNIIDVSVTLLLDNVDALDEVSEQTELDNYFDAYAVSENVNYNFSENIDTLALNGRSAIVSLKVENISS